MLMAYDNGLKRHHDSCSYSDPAVPLPVIGIAFSMLFHRQMMEVIKGF